MSKITKKQFLADVMHEIEMLKKHATPEEIARLDFGVFNPRNYDNCIYGQLTIDCRSDRAKELMDAACIRQMHTTDGGGECDLYDRTFSEISKFINGQYDGRTWNFGGEKRSWTYLSSLEGYINLKGAKNKQIIAYLKGEQSTLPL